MQNIGDGLMTLGGVVIAGSAVLPDTTPGSQQTIGLALGGSLLAVGRLVKAIGDRKAGQ